MTIAKRNTATRNTAQHHKVRLRQHTSHPRPLEATTPHGRPGLANHAPLPYAYQNSGTLDVARPSRTHDASHPMADPITVTAR